MPCEHQRDKMSERQLLDKSCFGEGGMAVPAARGALPDHWREFLCGGGAAFCNILISYPLNKLIFRQMMHGVETTFALNQLQKEGAAFLYRGMLPPLMQRSLSMSLMFGVYDECLQPLLNHNINPYVAKSVAGVVAGCVEATLMPFERLQTLLIHPKYHKEFKNTAHAIRDIARRYGIKEFYRGLTPILMRNGPSNAMFFIIRDEVRQLLPPQDQLFYKTLQDFLAGASIGAFLSTLFYPLNVIKIAMQCELGGPHRTIAYEFRYILRKRGSKFTNFYHGVHGNERPTYRADYIYEKAFDAFYKVHHAAASWAVARARCEAEGTALLVPASLDEADSMPVLTANILTRYQGVFVGMHDLYSEKFFVTINGSALADSILELLWENMEPRHLGGRCVAMRRSGRLFVHHCHDALPFICKTKTTDLTYQASCDTYQSSDMNNWELAPNGHCYMSHAEPQTWYDAYATCLATGGFLAILNNRSEADYVRDLFKRLGERRIPENDFAFLGFSDLFQRHHYRTVHGDRLEDVGYADWDIQCAQNGNLSAYRRCGGMRRSGLLSTGDCDTPAAFFCEKKGQNETKLRSNVPNIAAYHHYREKLLKFDKKTYFVF
ncbi:uncharacterized protein [Choristoneura fumiferana]|uniref:uncharacterized protein n=1 Tax=Choristoneura fumiferana TaxID=7141 RepID=UPI003D15B300